MKGPASRARVPRVLRDALELPMSMDAMRLFPMTEQGGNSLRGLLIEDRRVEHVEHVDAMLRLRPRLGGPKIRHDSDPVLVSLIQALDCQADELILETAVARTERGGAPALAR